MNTLETIVHRAGIFAITTLASGATLSLGATCLISAYAAIDTLKEGYEIALGYGIISMATGFASYKLGRQVPAIIKSGLVNHSTTDKHSGD